MVKVREDLTGKHIEGTMITVVKQADDYIDPRGEHRAQWVCKCDCGNTNEFIVLGSNLKRKHTVSCGCVHKSTMFDLLFNDLTNKRFGKLKVLYRTKDKVLSDGSTRVQWHCVCDCGNECDVLAQNLTKTNGPTKSCGCLSVETTKNRHRNEILNSENLISKKSNWLESLLKDKDDANKYTVWSNEKTYFICPECGEVLYKQICDVYRRRSLQCKCGDSISYPNKFVFDVLKQCNVNIDTEHIFNFAKDKRYDIFLPDYNIIVENHGIQHYDASKFFKKETEEIHKNDIFKKEVALKNGISKYIELDCRESSLEWIKHSIISSGILDILKINKETINWKQADIYATSSLVVKAAKMFNDGMMQKDIASEMNLSTNTIRSYLKKATQLGICNYTPKH